jgi:uncharacterized membrane protein
MLQRLFDKMPRLTPGHKRAAFILMIIVLLGTVVRVSDLTYRTMTHIEIYVPGIDLPAGLSIPAPRLTLRQTLSGLLVYEEPHPPGHYIFMLGWVKLLGSGILALRLPSVIFGVASIPLLYVVGARERGPASALLAAGMLAFNGYHVFWSQLSKMYILACLLGLLSTLLLLMSAKGGTGRRQLRLHILYSGATLLGLATSHYFWFLLIVHVVWVLIHIRPGSNMPGLLRVQFAIMIIGSPLFALAVFQSRRTSYLNPNILKGLSQYLQFGILFQPDYNAEPPGLFSALGRSTLAVTGFLVLVMGLASDKKKRDEPVRTTSTVGPWSLAIALSGLFAVLLTLLAAKALTGLDAKYALLVVASSVVPIGLTVTYIVAARYWRDLQRPLADLKDKTPGWLPTSLSSLLAVLPVALLVLISPATNLVTPRGLLLFVPYLLLVLASGLVALVQKSRYWLVLAAMLIALHPLSIRYYRHSFHEHPTDYQALAEQWIPKIEDSDLIFVEPHWVTTPIFYYLNGDEYHFVGWSYEEALRSAPGPRVWVLSFEGLPENEGLEHALTGYQPTRTIEALGIKAELYE